MNERQKPSAFTARQRRDRLPRPLHILLFTLGCLPLFWILGLEQIVPVPLVLGAALLAVWQRPRPILPPVVIALGLFVAWQPASTGAIAAADDWILFARNVLSYLTGGAVLLILVNDMRTPADLRQTMILCGILGAVSGLIAAAFVSGLLPATFRPPFVESLLPSGLRQSQFIQDNLLLREVGRPAARLGSLTYRRVSAIFLYPTGAAMGFAIFLTWAWFLWRRTVPRRARAFWLAAVVLTGIALLFTAARTAFLALAAAALLFPVWRHLMGWPRVWRLVMVAGAFLVLLTMLLWPGDGAPLALLEALFVNLRADSLTGRLAVYEASYRYWLERPLLGWGVPLDVPGVTLAPAGTHGEYLATIFRFGLIGFGFYTAVLLAIYARLLLRLRETWRGPVELFRFYGFIAAALLTITICGLTYGFYFDLVFVLLHWMVIGLLHLDPELPRAWLNPANAPARVPPASPQK